MSHFYRQKNWPVTELAGMPAGIKSIITSLIRRARLEQRRGQMLVARAGEDFHACPNVSFTSLLSCRLLTPLLGNF